MKKSTYYLMILLMVLAGLMLVACGDDDEDGDGTGAGDGEAAADGDGEADGDAPAADGDGEAAGEITCEPACGENEVCVDDGTGVGVCDCAEDYEFDEYFEDGSCIPVDYCAPNCWNWSDCSTGEFCVGDDCTEVNCVDDDDCMYIGACDDPNGDHYGRTFVCGDDGKCEVQ